MGLPLQTLRFIMSVSLATQAVDALAVIATGRNTGAAAEDSQANITERQRQRQRQRNVEWVKSDRPTASVVCL